MPWTDEQKQRARREADETINALWLCIDVLRSASAESLCGKSLDEIRLQVEEFTKLLSK